MGGSDGCKGTCVSHPEAGGCDKEKDSMKVILSRNTFLLIMSIFVNG
jgi:hypothetical protein